MKVQCGTCRWYEGPYDCCEYTKKWWGTAEHPLLPHYGTQCDRWLPVYINPTALSLDLDRIEVVPEKPYIREVVY